MEKLTPDDIHLYLDKLGIDEPLEPTLKTLSLLQQRHTEVLPFQSITTFAGKLTSLKLEDIVQKVLINHEGGYCYELNSLLYYLLQQLGFEVSILTGRIIHENNLLTPHPRTHALLKVTIDEKIYLCDVGYGGLVPPTPLLIENDAIQNTHLGLYQISYQPEYRVYTLSTKVVEEWRIIYSFNLMPEVMIDLELGNWFISTNPHSPFKARLMASKTEYPGIRHALLNDQYTIHSLGKPSIHHQLQNSDDIIEVIQTVFNLTIPDITALKKAIDERVRFDH